MPTAKVRAFTILSEFDQAQTELVGKAVILTDGKAGTVESVWLDEMHGLRIRSGATTGSGLSQPSNSRKATEFPAFTAPRLDAPRRKARLAAGEGPMILRQRLAGTNSHSPG